MSTAMDRATTTSTYSTVAPPPTGRHARITTTYTARPSHSRTLRRSSAACNINVPACGVGMTCWPTAPRAPRWTPTGVTCNCPGGTCQAAELPRMASSSVSSVRRRSSSSSTAPWRRPVPVYDPCDDWPVTDDPTCWNYVHRRAAGMRQRRSRSGLTSWAIGGIVVLRGRRWWEASPLFIYKRWKAGQGGVSKPHAGQMTKQQQQP